MTTHFGHALARARKLAGLSQGQLADRVGVTYTQLGHYEQGRRRPNDATAARYARALGLSADAFAVPLYRDRVAKRSIVVVDLARFIAGLTDGELLTLRSPQHAAALAAAHEDRALAERVEEE